MKNPEWWKDFFSGLALVMWREAMSTEHTKNEARFIRKHLQVSPPGRILDVPCGTGRLSLELASQGFLPTGVDLSSSFLDVARLTDCEQQRNIAWEHRDMRDLPWKDAFDGAFCFGNSFGYLEDEGNADFLNAVYNVLKPGSRLIFDACSVLEAVLPRIQDRTEMKIGDVLFIEENHYDHIQGRLETNYTFILDNKVEKKFGSHRLYTYRELSELISNAGFLIQNACGSLDDEPFNLSSMGLYFVATKPELS
jgi:cyclopropane fatty-acyl-phospholipid synthase-like methyltransferase